MIRPASTDDLSRIMTLFDKARGIMRSDGNMGQWVNGYPQKEVAEADIAQGYGFIVEDSKSEAVGYFAFIPGIEPTYLKIYQGQWLEDSRPYATIHRLASTPESHGVAQECFSWCWQHCRNLRIDTHRDNRIMQHVISDFGFVYCGIIYLADGSERLAYQKAGF